MLFQSSLAVFGLATLAQSHMIMNTPVPFGKSSLNNSPLDARGADFPCKQRAGVYDAEGADNQMALGSVQPLSFTGSAVHGGGSCQISITYDKEPTVNSVWKVIHSIEGGCPMRDVAGNNGNDANQISPSKYSFTVPNNLPTGQAVLAWSWFNKVGNREMYMNCAPITLTGGASKRSDEELVARNETQLVERDTAAYDALPDMLVANINSCQIPDSKNVVFSNPGASVEKNGLDDTNAFTETCGGAAAPTGNSGSAPSSAAQATTAPAQAAPSKSGLPGGVFVTVPTGGDSAPTPSPSSPAQAPAPSSPAKAPSAAPVAAPSSVPAPAPAPSQPELPAGTGTTGSGSALSGSCTPEGQWNCIGGTSFQRCASGSWSAVQQLAAGTTCASGESSAINISAISKEKRAIRFSHEHIRRHIRSS